jgi:hypothetical protein
MQLGALSQTADTTVTMWSVIICAPWGGSLGCINQPQKPILV